MQPFYRFIHSRTKLMSMKRFLPTTLFVVFSLFLSAQSFFDGVSIHTIEFVDKPSALDKRFYGSLAYETPEKAWVGFADLYTDSRKFANPLGYIQNDSFFVVKNFPFTAPQRVYDLEWAGQKLYVASDVGLLIYENGTWSKMADLPSDYVRSVDAKNGNIILSGDSGIVLIKGQQQTRFTVSNSKLPSHEIRQVETDASGNIYAATAEGLFLRINNKELVYHTSNSDLPSNLMSALVLQGNTLWVASDDINIEQHLFYVDLNSENLVIPGSNDACFASVSSSPIYRLVEGDKGDIWYTSKDPFAFGTTEFVLLQNRDAIRFTLNIDFWSGFGKNHLFHLRGPGMFQIIDDLGQLYTWEPANFTLSPGWSTESLTFLDINKVSAPIIPDAQMFWQKQGAAPKYEVPKNSCLSTTYIGGLWIGGLDNDNDLHLAATTYGLAGSDYTFGVLNRSTGRMDSALTFSLKLNEPRRVTRRDIEEFKKAFADGDVQNGSYPIPMSISNWPGTRGPNSTSMLAPFEDVNQDGKYDPKDGDYPKIKGDMAIFHVYHDDIFHTETYGARLFIEVHVMSYAYNCNDIDDKDPNSVINYTTFHEYTIHNFSQNTYHNLYAGQFTDVDLGDYSDDVIGCDTALNMGFVYNGDNSDLNGGYGDNPPTQAIVFYDQELDVFAYYKNDFSGQGNPSYAPHYYNYLQGLYKDGSAMEDPNGNAVKHMFTGTPYGNGFVDDLKGDKRMLMAVGPKILAPGKSLKLSFAMVYSRVDDKANGPNTSYKKMKDDVTKVHAWVADQSFPSCDGFPNGIDEASDAKFTVYPNPGNEQVNLVMPKGVEWANYRIIDIQGRVVMQGKVFNDQPKLQTIALKNGYYLIELQGEFGRMVQAWVKN